MQGISGGLFRRGKQLLLGLRAVQSALLDVLHNFWIEEFADGVFGGDGLTDCRAGYRSPLAGGPSLSPLLRRLGTFIRHRRIQPVDLVSTHALGTETLSTNASTAFHHIQLLSPRSLYGNAGSQKHIRSFSGTYSPLVRILYRWLCRNAGARSFADQRAGTKHPECSFADAKAGCFTKVARQNGKPSVLAATLL
jgi:hypothetical protein